MTISYSFNIKSHPHKTLYAHLKNVGEIGKEIFSQKNFEFHDLYGEISYLIGISHDFGKATTYFQERLANNVKTEKAYHGLISGVFGYYLVKKATENIKKIKIDHLPAMAFVIISRHHGNLHNLLGTNGELQRLTDEMDILNVQIENIKKYQLQEVKNIYFQLESLIHIEDFLEKFEEIVEQLKIDCRKLGREQSIKNYFHLMMLYSALLDGDKLDASGIERCPDRRKFDGDNLVDTYKVTKFGKIKRKEIDNIRERAYVEIVSKIDNIDIEKDRILSIELPTGCGKTLIAVSFALKLRKRIENSFRFTPRIIYSLPFLSIIEQNSEVISEVLLSELNINLEKLNPKNRIKKLNSIIPSDLFLRHHHLSDIYYKTESEEYTISESILLTQGWNSEIIVTTFVQFFHSLITNKNRAARKFHNISNSIVILDEIQSVPYKYWDLFRNALDYMSKTYNCWIILMTATQPFIFSPEKIMKLISNKKDYFEKLDRVNYYIDIEPESIDSFKREILEEIKAGEKDMLIVLNTVDCCKKVYNYLKNELEKHYKTKSLVEKGVVTIEKNVLINLSREIVPKYRSERISSIKNIKNKRKIVVSTQLIEAGVDISADIVYRDLAPLDSIVQCAGRCNRNGTSNEKGMLILKNLKDEKSRFYWQYIYDSMLVNATIETIGKIKKESEAIFVSRVEDYYNIIYNRSNQENIFSYLEKLQFDEINNFKLIEDSYPSIDVFVEIDTEGKKVYSKYAEINKLENPLERRNEILKINKDFKSYIISVSFKVAEDLGIMINNDIGYVPFDQLSKIYDVETGIIKNGKNALIL